MNDPTEIITYSQPSTGFGFFQCSRRTAAHLDYTKAELARLHPGAELVIIQGCFNSAVPASEGTHDFDCVLDGRIVGLSEPDTQRFLRTYGWGDWWRKPSQGPWVTHHHMISLGFAKYGLKVGKYIDGGLSTVGQIVTSSQVMDYYRHTFGLSGVHNWDADKSWFPGDEGPPPWPVGTPDQWAAAINATVFDFEQWEESLMEYKDWSAESKKAMVDDVVKAMLAAEVRRKTKEQNALTAKAAWRQAAEKA